MATTITYNGYIINKIVGRFHFSHNYRSASVACDFLIIAASSSALVEACSLAEIALREWNRSLVVVFGSSGSEQYNYSHSGNTGFLAQPSLKKSAGKADLACSRMYSFTCEVSLPADQSGYNYRQEGHVNFSQEIHNRKMLAISGKYTAGSTKSAYENYTEHGVVWADSIAGVFGAYELMNTSCDYEQENKVLSFRRNYREKQTLNVTYNGYHIPGDYYDFNFSETYEQATFSLEFAILHVDADGAEAALRIYNADLDVTMLSGAYHYSHAGNTGFLAKPSLSLISKTTGNDLYRFYRFSITVSLPADADGYKYRQSGSYAIGFLATNQRMVNFTCVYTAGGNLSAMQNYNATSGGGRNWAERVLAALGGTYELISEKPGVEHQDKICNASLSYRELLDADFAGGMDYTSIKNALLSCSATFPEKRGVAISSGYQCTPPEQISVRYSADIDKNLVAVEALSDLYRNIVRPWIIPHAASVVKISGSFVVQDESYQIDPTNFKVTGSITFLAVSALGAILELRERISISRNAGLVLTKIWDGNPHTYNVYGIGGKMKLRRSITVVAIGAFPDPPPDYTDDSQGVWLKESENRDDSQELQGFGLQGGPTVDGLLCSSTITEEYTYVMPSFANDVAAGNNWGIRG